MKLYVNDILTASNYMEMITATKGLLALNFDMKDVGDVSNVLRVRSIGINLRGFSFSRKRTLKTS